MDTISQERFDSLMELIREDVNSLTTSDVEFLRARASYMDEEENAIMMPLFQNAGEGVLIAQATSEEDKHIKDANLAHPVEEARTVKENADEASIKREEETAADGVTVEADKATEAAKSDKAEAKADAKKDEKSA